MRRVVLAALAGLTLAPAAQALPPGFSDSLVTAVAAPTAMAFAPDGRMLVTTQPGRLYLVENGTRLPTPALDIAARTCSTSERGLLGAAVDPLFAMNGHVYLFYTAEVSGTPSCVNRISRFTFTAPSTIDPGSELVLVDRMPSTAGNHNGGDLAFGKDGHLYATIGDGGCDYASPTACQNANDAARDRHVLLGKVLRITGSGGIPPDNPFTGSGTARCNLTGQTTPGQDCQETFAWGLRNPFRFAFDSNTPAGVTRFFVNDVGGGTWEEIDEGLAGADYGWNVREGPCALDSTTSCGPPPNGMTNPIHAYSHAATGCRSITGGAFVPNGVWPAEYDGSYLFADYVCGRIFRLQPSAGGWTRTEFETGLGLASAVAMAFGPHGSTQALYYTTYRDGGQVRRISFSGPPPAPNAAPAASVAAPPGDLRPRAGETVTFTGSATDAEDGALAPERLSWRVLRHHGTSHTHPWVSPTPGTSVQVPVPEPEDLATAAASFLEVELTATDSRGATATVTRELRPRLGTLALATRPLGLRVLVEGETIVAPRLLTWTDGGDLLLEAPAQTDSRGVPWTFAAWSDGHARRHAVAVPGSVRAQFVPAIRIAGIRPRGREWIRIRNVGTLAVSLRGWTLGDRAVRAFRFGRIALAPGSALTVATGSSLHGTWRRARDVWSDGGDGARLRTPAGALVDACAYGARAPAVVRC